MALIESGSGVANTLGNVMRAAYELAFETSPVILNQGICSSIPGGMMPLGIVGILGTVAGLISNTVASYIPDQKFVPIPGATAISNDVATYPFANRYVAGNAVIRKPKTVSLMFIAPVNSDGGYMLKTALFTLMQTTLEKHIDEGGTFHVLTPSMIYFDCLLGNVSDITGGAGNQQQIQWQFDFMQPLITQSSANSALSSMANALSGGQQVTSSSLSDNALSSGASGIGGLIGASSFSGAIG